MLAFMDTTITPPSDYTDFAQITNSLWHKGNDATPPLLNGLFQYYHWDPNSFHACDYDVSSLFPLLFVSVDKLTKGVLSMINLGSWTPLDLLGLLGLRLTRFGSAVNMGSSSHNLHLGLKSHLLDQELQTLIRHLLVDFRTSPFYAISENVTTI